MSGRSAKGRKTGARASARGEGPVSGITRIACGPTMPGRSAKRRKTGATALAGVPAFDSLPPELLETIFGLLDVRTLCTARLVCAQFRDAASRGLHSVTLSVENLRTRPATTLNSFPNLRRVTVFDVKEDDLLILAQSPLADAVTHLRASEHLRLLPPRRGQIATACPQSPVRDAVTHVRAAEHLRLLPPRRAGIATACPPPPQSPVADAVADLRAAEHLRLLSLRRGGIATACLPLPALPNLVSLTVSRAAGRAFSFPRTLRELTLGGPVTAQTAKLVAKVTALQRLEICSCLSVIPFLVELTMLTHLQFTETWRWASPPASTLASLTRLQRLVHLGVGPFRAGLELELLASIGTIASLRSLHLYSCGESERPAFDVTLLSRLTALRLESRHLDVSAFPRLNLEGLQRLSLSAGVELDRDAVAALRRATGLTHLVLCEGCTIAAPEELGAVLAGMTRLRGLSLGCDAAFQARFCSRALGLLTELTRLDFGVTTNADLEVCLGLKKLRVLAMWAPEGPPPAPSHRITLEAFFAVAKLPELRRLDMVGNFGLWEGELRDDVWAWLNAERHGKGWPLLQLNVSR